MEAHPCPIFNCDLITEMMANLLTYKLSMAIKKMSMKWIKIF
jgi:hypothetical protein